MNTNLTIPNGSVEIQEVNGVKYLVARLDTSETSPCSQFVSELKNGKPVVVPWSKRSHLTTLLKHAGVFTRQKTLVPGHWVTFLPCPERKFKE